jgi:hypothetical protein
VCPAKWSLGWSQRYIVHACSAVGVVKRPCTLVSKILHLKLHCFQAADLGLFFCLFAVV